MESDEELVTEIKTSDKPLTQNSRLNRDSQSAFSIKNHDINQGQGLVHKQSPPRYQEPQSISGGGHFNPAKPSTEARIPNTEVRSPTTEARFPTIEAKILMQGGMPNNVPQNNPGFKPNSNVPPQPNIPNTPLSGTSSLNSNGKMGNPSMRQPSIGINQPLIKAEHNGPPAPNQVPNNQPPNLPNSKQPINIFPGTTVKNPDQNSKYPVNAYPNTPPTLLQGNLSNNPDLNNKFASNANPNLPSNSQQGNFMNQPKGPVVSGSINNPINKNPQISLANLNQGGVPTNFLPPHIPAIPNQENPNNVGNPAQLMNNFQGKIGAKADPVRTPQNMENSILGSANKAEFQPQPGFNQFKPPDAVGAKKDINQPQQIFFQGGPKPQSVSNQEPSMRNPPPLLSPEVAPAIPATIPPMMGAQQSSPSLPPSSFPGPPSGAAKPPPSGLPANMMNSGKPLAGPPIQNAPGNLPQNNLSNQNKGLPSANNSQNRDQIIKPQSPNINPIELNSNPGPIQHYPSVNQMQVKPPDMIMKSISPQKYKIPGNPLIPIIGKNLDIKIPKNEIPEIRKFLPDQIISHLDAILNDIKSIFNLNDISSRIEEVMQKLESISSKGCVKSKEIIEYILSAYRCNICHNSDIQNTFELRCGDQFCRNCLVDAANQTEGIHKMRCLSCKVECDAAQEEKIWMLIGYRKSDLENLNLKYKHQVNGALECKQCKKHKKQYYSCCYHICKECFAEGVRNGKAPCVTCHEECNYDEIVNEVFACSNCEAANYFVGSYGKYIHDENFIFCVSCSYDYLNTSYNSRFDIKLKKLDKVELNDHLFSLCWICNVEVFKENLISLSCPHRFCKTHDSVQSCNLCIN